VLTDAEFAAWRVDVDQGVPDSSRRAMAAVTSRVSSGAWRVVISGVAGYLPSPRLAELDRRLREHAIARTAGQLARVGWLLGRRPVAPATWTDLATIMDVSVCGTAISSLVAPWITAPDWHRGADGTDRPMLAVMAEELVERLTTEGRDDTAPFERIAPAVPELPDSWTAAQRRALDVGVELLSRQLRNVPADLDAFGTVTVARVARTAGVSRQTVYSRWRSDDDLRLDVLRRFADAHIRSFRSVDHDPWVPTEDWRRTLSFSMGFLAFADRVGPRLPWLAFAPYAGDERVAAELERVARHCIDEAASVTERSLASVEELDRDRLSPRQRAEIGFAGWLGARRRAQIRLRLDPSPEVWRAELRLTSLLVHVFGGAPGVHSLPHLLGPLDDAELPPLPAAGHRALG
jgi:AcrR family transcriptional regulator